MVDKITEVKTKEEGLLKLRRFSDRFNDLANEFFPNEKNLLVNLSVLWNVHVEGEDEDKINSLTTLIKPQSFEATYDLIQQIHFKDPMFVQIFTELLARSFASYVVTANAFQDAYAGKTQVDADKLVEDNQEDQSKESENINKPTPGKNVIN